MRHSVLVTAAALFVVLAGTAIAGDSRSVQLASVDCAFIAETNLGNHFLALLRKMNLEPPRASLLSGAYEGLVRSDDHD
jgi:hypothetical protein